MDMHIAPTTVREIAGEFRRHKPYGYASVGGLFDPATVLQVAREVESNLALYPQEADIYASYRKHRLSELDAMPEHARAFVAGLNAPPFLRVLSTITGIDNLRPDPELRGGGIHAIGRGGYLKLHTDFNWHRGLSMYRRLNLLVYLNEGWQDAWHGNIELWSADARERIFSLSPRIGHALLFETNDISYHGHPDPLACPEGVFRKSIALYYYTPTRPASDLRFGKSEMTNFVTRPAEKFETDRVRWLRQRLRLGAKRLAYALRRSRRD
ncbi:MAG TPA: 2OG-Fe(II) oxygenase [Rhodanobacteraceae bacterium]|nr:2OG-Fe(II) oxygenase [Rhodanobacteraceae bacterium]